MTVLSIKRDMAPEKGPNIVRIETDNTIEQIVQPDWLLGQRDQITALNEGEWEWRLNDVLLINFDKLDTNNVQYAKGASFFYMTPDFATVIPVAPIYPNLQNIVAHAGGGQANATQINIGINVIVTVASAGDSVKLPENVLDQTVIVVNRGANSVNIYPAVGDQIDSLAVDAPIALTAGNTLVFYGTDVTRWNSK